MESSSESWSGRKWGDLRKKEMDRVPLSKQESRYGFELRNMTEVVSWKAQGQDQTGMKEIPS